MREGTPLSPVPLYFSSLSLLCTALHYLNAWNRLSCDTSTFLGRFPIHTGPTPALTPKTMLVSCIQNFCLSFNFVRQGGVRTARKF